MRRTNAATYLQKRWRGYHQRQKYLHVRHAVITIQAFTRGMYGRRYYTKVLRQARATTIQRTVRGWLARRRYHKARKSIILLQCCTRRMYAKRELKKLKVSRVSSALVTWSYTRVRLTVTWVLFTQGEVDPR